MFLLAINQNYHKVLSFTIYTLKKNAGPSLKKWKVQFQDNHNFEALQQSKHSEISSGDKWAH